MSRYHSYLNSASHILLLYKGEEPFSSFLRKYFSQHKKMGSSDRKQVSHLCYCYFRMGKALPALPAEEKLLLSLFLCSAEPVELLQQLKPAWNENITMKLNDKIKLSGYAISPDSILPWGKELSADIEQSDFILSHFIQPDLFLRLRPGKEKMVLQKLTVAGIPFNNINENCIAITNSSKIDELIELDKEAVVQDYSSQRVGELLSLIPDNNKSLTAWDCCAASGGKSIMLYDLYPTVQLTVSDIRESILANLKKRFSMAGITNYKSFIADLAVSDSVLPTSYFQLIIADVPCTGSGTWGRTPEQLFYFAEKKIAAYAGIQKKIISQAIPYILPGGYFLYITCSVFKKENEDAVNFIQENFQLELIQQQVLKGYSKKADTMFAVLLRKQQ